MIAYIRDYTHTVIDTEGNPSDEDFRDLAEACDLMVVPAVPESVANDGLTHTLAKLHELRNDKFRVLLTMVPPKPRTEGKQLRDMLLSEGIPVFKGEIPRLAAYEAAAARGVAARDLPRNVKNSNRAWSAYEAIGKDILR